MTTPLEFKQWITHVQTPAVERLLKQAAESNVISFAGGLPADELFPLSALEDAFKRVITDQAAEALQYSWSEGHEPLRRQIAEHLQSLGINARPREILITHGAQQGLDLLGKLLLRPDDALALESPTYVAAIQAFELQQPRFCAVERTVEGLALDSLRYILQRQAPKLCYLVPTGHNPTGGTLTEAERVQVIDLATEFGTYIIEDAAYGDLQYEAPQAPIKAYDDIEDRVIYLGTFSKILTPGLRVGWIFAPEEIIKQLILIKGASDLQTSSLSQLVISLYLTEHSLPDHLNKCIAFYRQRRDVMLEALDRLFPAEVAWSRPNSGFSVWVRLPEELSAEELLPEAIRQEVAFEPGQPFFPTEKLANFFRLSFSHVEPERIEEGIGRLAEVLKARLTQL